jgi:thiol-disulfide isomerase/thioredoxin
MRAKTVLAVLLAAVVVGFGYDKFLRKLPAPPAGKPAPEIAGVDLDGKPMTLSEHRGRIVVLTFWGYWCSTCRAEMPEKKALAARYAGKPVVFLGVNSDGDREATARRAAAEGVPGRSFWNDGRFSGAATEWGVRSWPSTFVIDAAGTLRFEKVKMPDLAAKLEELLAEDAAAPSRSR